MDTATPADFGRLMQYGAVGIVAAGLLTLVVVLFRQFVNHALDQNKKLMEQQHEMLSANLTALHGVTSALKDVENTIHEVGKDLAYLYNEVSSLSGNSRPIRIRPPRGGSGSG